MVTPSKQKLQIYHLISKQSVSFDAFITEFNDKHSAEWSTEPVYGRMDDLQSFQRTKRTISLTIDCPSESESQALLNLDQISSLKQFLYPSYQQRSNALSLQGGPLFRVKLLNFLNNHIDEKGILCTIASINFSPNQEAGFFILSSQDLNRIDTSRKYDLKVPMIVPKLFSFSLEMNIIHEFTPGWTGKANNKKFEKESYPYSVQYKKDRKPDKQTSEGVNNKAIDPNSVKAIDPNSVIAINANSVLPYIPEKTENIAINQASKTLKQVKK